MVPYLNASLLVQLLIPLLPSLERLQNEEGTIGRQQITKYTRYLTLTWSILLSSYTAFGVIKPFVFNWNTIIALKIILSLTIGSLIIMNTWNTPSILLLLFGTSIIPIRNYLTPMLFTKIRINFYIIIFSFNC